MDSATWQRFKPGTFRSSLIFNIQLQGRGVNWSNCPINLQIKQPMSLLEADRERKQVTFLKSSTFLSPITPDVDPAGRRPCLPRVDCSTRAGKCWTGGIFFIAHPGQSDDLYCGYSPPRVHNIAFALHCPDLVTPKGN